MSVASQLASQPKVLMEIIEAFKMFKSRDSLLLKKHGDSEDDHLKSDRMYDAVFPYAEWAYILPEGAKIDLAQVSMVTGLTEKKDLQTLIFKVTMGYFTNPGCGILDMKYEYENENGEVVLEFPLNVIVDSLKEDVPLVLNGVTYDSSKVMVNLYRNNRV